MPVKKGICSECNRERRGRITVNQRRVLHALMSGPKTVAEIAKVVKCHTESVREALNFWAEYKIVRIAGWSRYAEAGAFARVYGIGKEPDCEKPEPLTNSEKSRRARYRNVFGVGHTQGKLLPAGAAPRIGVWGL